MANRECIPKVPAPRRGGLVSFHREYLIRVGLLRPAPPVVPPKLPRILQGLAS